ncbi:FAD-dependent oxidoreductase [Fibrella sp. WM1]|uniref:FAD-dependent oxidoreductase n=1 Tax=Fibrella musci TaxID=3242485 RepID=UPI0035228D95
MKTVRTISVLGAGLVGSLLALMLSRRGYALSIYEKRADSRRKNTRGRSINLAVSCRAWKAIEQVGLTDQVRPIALPMYGRQIHHLDGTESFMPYGGANEAIYAVSRQLLNEVLLNAVSADPSIALHFDTPCLEVDFARSTFTVCPPDAAPTACATDLLIGADGLNSVLRSYYPTLPAFQLNTRQIAQAYKELTIPASVAGEFQLQPDRLHIWPRQQFMMIALPNIDGSFTGTLFLPSKGPVSFDALQTDAAIDDFFATYFADLIPLVPTLTAQFNENPVSALMSVDCYPWCYQDKAMLVGDAAHAILPFFGQGMNAGFEDCSTIMALLDDCEGDWACVMATYQQQRKRDTDAIAALSLQNYEEMQAKVADPRFLLRKQIDAKLTQEYPDRWRSLYGMVSFSDVPYHQVVKVGKQQTNLLDQIMATDNIESVWQELDYTPLLMSKPVAELAV